MNKVKYISFFVGLVFLSTAAIAKETCWNVGMTTEQKEKAQHILAEEKPKISALRAELRKNMHKLKSFTYAGPEDHQKLALLGQELQSQRQELCTMLDELNIRLQDEAGVSLRGYKKRKCAKLSRAITKDSIHLEKHVKTTPHHVE